jgi:hypothetical protein
MTNPSNNPLNNASATTLWHYNTSLVLQAARMIERLLTEVKAGFVYAQAVGPHVRHTIEHYQALLGALAVGEGCVDYDARLRDLRVQTDPTMTLAALQHLTASFATLAEDPHLHLDTPLTTRLQAGAKGELELQVKTTLGRELLFLSSHTVHHYALIGQYCRAAGVEMGHDFGKAPATVAFEQAHAAISA